MDAHSGQIRNPSQADNCEATHTPRDRFVSSSHSVYLGQERARSHANKCDELKPRVCGSFYVEPL